MKLLCRFGLHKLSPVFDRKKMSIVYHGSGRPHGMSFGFESDFEPMCFSVLPQTCTRCSVMLLRYERIPHRDPDPHYNPSIGFYDRK